MLLKCSGFFAKALVGGGCVQWSSSVIKSGGHSGVTVG